MELRCLLTLVTLSLWCVPEAEGTVFLLVNGSPVATGECFQVTTNQQQISVYCKYFNDRPHLVEVSSNGHTLPLTILNSTIRGNPALLYHPPLSSNGQHTYKCQDSASSVSITISFYAPCQIVAHPTTVPTPSSPSGRPPTIPTGGGQNSPKFTGLNPLIYTISAVILLGTLAIVSIITCWIRARRSFNSRVLRANNTPQDYLDYISDNEFTPLTTSEFVASLQERPPTYHESEQIEQDTRTGQNADDPTATDTTVGGLPGGEDGVPLVGNVAVCATTSTTSETGTLPPPPNRPLPPIPTSSQEPQNRASSRADQNSATPALTNRSPVTNILDMEAGSETQGGVLSPPAQSTLGGSERTSPAVAIGTLIDVEVDQSSVSSPETVMTPPVLPIDDMLSLTGGEIEPTQEAGNVQLIQVSKRTE